MKMRKNTPVSPQTELDRDSTQVQAKVLRRFRAIFSAIRSHFQLLEKSSGVAGAQIWAMSILYQQPGIGVGQLAKSMDIHQTTASNLLRAMQKSKLVLVEKSSTDRRHVQIFLLPDGQKILRDAPKPHMGLLPHVLQQLDSATLTRLEADLGILQNLMSVDQKTELEPLGQSSWTSK